MNTTQLKKIYINFKIEYHRRYGGTYMLFGMKRETLRWYLLGETLLPNESSDWSNEFDCRVPEIAYRPTPDSEVVASYTKCNCCRPLAYVDA